MALKSAYKYVRNNIDNSFDKYVADNVSYGCEEDIEDIKRYGYLKKGKTLQWLYIMLSTKVRTYSMISIYTLKEWTSHMTTILLQL